MTGETLFLLACLSLILVVGIGLLGRSIIRLARMTVEDIDAAEAQGE